MLPVTHHATKPFIYLASQSPRRAELLAQLGVAHRLLLAHESEDAESLEVIHGREAPSRYVQRVTKLKLQAAIERAQHRNLWNALDAPPILCADTTVAMGRMILGKPDGIRAAEQMLGALSGKSHRVLTSVGLAWRVGQQVKTGFALSESRVTFARLSKADIAAFIGTDEPFGKAGAYGVQGKAAAFIPNLSGSYSGIMGLPLFETAQLLKKAKFL